MRGKIRRFLFMALRLTVESMLIRQLAHDISAGSCGIFWHRAHGNARVLIEWLKYAVSSWSAGIRRTLKKNKRPRLRRHVKLGLQP
jgi:hypothetical protein